jgi:hypothetical protein
MDDVGELVREHEAQPVVVVAEVFAPVGGDGAHVHQRIRQGGGEAVGVVLHVGEDEVHAPDVDAEPRFVALQDLGGEGGRAPRHPFQPLVEMDGDAVGGDAAEPQLGGKGSRTRRRGAGQEERGCHQEPVGAATHQRTRVP